MTTQMTLASFQAAANFAAKIPIQVQSFVDYPATTYSTDHVSIDGFARGMGAARYAGESSMTCVGHTWSRKQYHCRRGRRRKTNYAPLEMQYFYG
ncbi:hypothetical protein DTO282E5_1685 [Paecilomyces variotii]|nr:hypothetical protein DTO282E5_1685 [Paecilomyces variotii]